MLELTSVEPHLLFVCIIQATLCFCFSSAGCAQNTTYSAVEVQPAPVTLLYQCSSPFKIHGDDEVLRHMGLHLDTPPPALSPHPSMQIPQMLPEQSSQNLIQAGHMLPEQATPQVCILSFDCRHIAVHAGIRLWMQEMACVMSAIELFMQPHSVYIIPVRCTCHMKVACKDWWLPHLHMPPSALESFSKNHFGSCHG